MSDEKKPARKFTPDIKVGAKYRDLRFEQLKQLDEANPDFVHSYQSPDIFGANAKTYEWTMRVKGQEVVKGEDGQVLHHMGDPVVRTPKKLVTEQRLEEAERSKRSVESVVKPQRSTVKRSPKSPIDSTDDEKG